MIKPDSRSKKFDIQQAKEDFNTTFGLHAYACPAKSEIRRAKARLPNSELLVYSQACITIFKKGYDIDEQ